MGLRINTNIAAVQAQRNVEQSTARLSKSIDHLSSGKRITSAGDDPTGMAVENILTAKERSLGAASRNTSLGISLVQTAEGSLTEVSSLLNRMKELSMLSSSDTLGENERQYVDLEFQQIKSEIDRIAKVTEFNGQKLLMGTQNDPVMRIQVGVDSDESSGIGFDVSENDSRVDNLGLSSSSVSEQNLALDSLAEIDHAIGKVNGMRARLGADQNRLQSVTNTINNQIISTTEARSKIGDADVAHEAANLAKDNIIQQAGIAVLAQATQMPGSALRLL